MTATRSNTKLLLAIVGPTAAGKSRMAMQLAQKWDTEILSADSRQCYRELNIGTGKPSMADLEAVPHHFINSHSIHAPISAGDYERYSEAVLGRIFAAKDIAILCGGTGLYINAALGILSEMPAVAADIAEATNTEYGHKGLAWLQDSVHAVDPQYYASVDPNNVHRLLRGLIFWRSHAESILKYKDGKRKPRNFNVLKIGVNLPRPQLYAKIDARVAEMMAHGLAEEARALAAIFPKAGLKTIGYTEFYDAAPDDTDDEIAKRIMQHTRRYAKRQLTWFKADDELHWVAPEDVDEVAAIVAPHL